MKKIVLALSVSVLLYAEIINGVALTVEGEPITLLEIKQEMRTMNTDAKRATDMLIRQKLEALEIEKRDISVSTSDVYEDIKKTAAANNMNVSQFYDAVREANGINSTELKEKIKEKLLSQKLYAAIAYSSVAQPSQNDIEEYYALHKEEFKHPSSFEVTIYNAKERSRLEQKIANPMLYAPDVVTNDQTLPYTRIAPELASLLEATEVGSFSQVVPDGQGGFFSFYLRKKEQAQEADIQSVQDEIVNAIMAQKREQVLGDYFARLRHNADIRTLRDVE